jgi:beta-carotene 3-hydroxylase
MSLTVVLIFTATFVGMEFVAWFLHKYVMHGFLWSLHADHHDPNHGKVFEKNDSFAFFFFAPSFLSILFGSIYANAELSAFGYGIMAYGAVYFVVHEIIIHRRMTWFKSKGFYLNALVAAHKKHHANREKENGTNFGMLLIPITYFERSLRHRRKTAGS